jgi:hypothetical protein
MTRSIIVDLFWKHISYNTDAACLCILSSLNIRLVGVFYTILIFGRCCILSNHAHKTASSFLVRTSGKKFTVQRFQGLDTNDNLVGVIRVWWLCVKLNIHSTLLTFHLLAWTSVELYFFLTLMQPLFDFHSFP